MAAGFMPIGDFKVTYRDGTEELAKSNFRGLVEIERKWPGQDVAPGIEAMGLAVWHYLDCPGDFDDWLDSVHLIEAAEAKSEDEVPTQPAVGVAS